MKEDLAFVVVDATDHRVVITIRGEVDLSNADEVERAVLKGAQGSAAVVVDLSEVRYMDSRGIRLLYELVRQVSPRDLTLVAPSDGVAGQVIAVTGLDDLAPVVEVLSDVS